MVEKNDTPHNLERPILMVKLVVGAKQLETGVGVSLRA